jgi:hypothetical protein
MGSAGAKKHLPALCGQRIEHRIDGVFRSLYVSPTETVEEVVIVKTYPVVVLVAKNF